MGTVADYDKKTTKAFDSLQAGDLFHEHFSYHVLVIEIRNDFVCYAQFNGSGKLLENSTFEWTTLGEFKKYHAYSTPGMGYWVTLSKRNVKIKKSWKKAIPELKRNYQKSSDCEIQDHRDQETQERSKQLVSLLIGAENLSSTMSGSMELKPLITRAKSILLKKMEREKITLPCTNEQRLLRMKTS